MVNSDLPEGTFGDPLARSYVESAELPPCPIGCNQGEQPGDWCGIKKGYVFCHHCGFDAKIDDWKQLSATMQRAKELREEVIRLKQHDNAPGF